MPDQLPSVPFLTSLSDKIEFNLFPIDHIFEKGNDLPIFPHKIEFYQIVLITQGNGKHIIDFHEYSYRRGTLFSVAKNQAQVFKYFPGTKGYVFVFTDQFLYKHKTDLELLSNLNLFNHYIYEPVLQLGQKDLADLITIIHQIEKETGLSDDPNSEEIIRSLLRVFILKAERIKGRKSQTPRKDGDYEFFLKFKNDLDERFADTRQVSDYYENLNITYRKFSRILKKYTGKTPKEFIDERVVLETKRLLTHTSMSIKEIAYTVGFDDPTNLTKFFKTYTKLLPSEFRH